jgi:voltage-gated potassium channel Kch
MAIEEPGSSSETPSEHLVGSDRIPLRERYGLVLSLILVAYILGGIEDERVAAVINSLIWGSVLFATLWSPGLPPILRRIGIGAISVFILSSASIWIVSSPTTNGWRLLILAAAQLAALLAILARIAQHRVVTFQSVMGGVAAYALIAFVMAAVYQALTLLAGTPALLGLSTVGDYMYFSFVTLTTVGYGDISPATDLAKRLAVVEMFVGQVFLITLIARLVSLWKVPEGRGEGRSRS